VRILGLVHTSFSSIRTTIHTRTHLQARTRTCARTPTCIHVSAPPRWLVPPGRSSSMAALLSGVRGVEGGSGWMSLGTMTRSRPSTRMAPALPAGTHEGSRGTQGFSCGHCQMDSQPSTLGRMAQALHARLHASRAGRGHHYIRRSQPTARWACGHITHALWLWWDAHASRGGTEGDCSPRGGWGEGRAEAKWCTCTYTHAPASCTLTRIHAPVSCPLTRTQALSLPHAYSHAHT